MTIPQAQQGFSLLEAIVALVLLSTVGMALFSWLNSNLISLNRAQVVSAHTQTMGNALEYLTLINPSEQPRGEERLGELTISWQARLIDGPLDNAGYPGGIGLYELALYDTQVTLRYQQQPPSTFTVRQIGYRQVRKSEAR